MTQSGAAEARQSHNLEVGVESTDRRKGASYNGN